MAPLGKIFSNRLKVIVWVQDFHYESMHQKVRPMANSQYEFKQILKVQILSLLNQQSKTRAGAIKHVKKIWESYANDYPLEFHFWMLIMINFI